MSNSLTKYIEENDTLALRIVPEDIKHFFFKNIPKCLYKYQNEFNEYKKRALESFDIISRIDGEDCCDISKIKGLKWIGNSCYLDSTLFALL